MGNSSEHQQFKNNYQVVKNQGNGDLLLKHNSNNSQLMMRILTFNTEQESNDFIKLLEKRKKIKNPHLLQILEINKIEQKGMCSNSFRLQLIVEYPFKTLHDEINERQLSRRNFGEDEMWSILFSCCHSLNTLYKNKLPHQSLSSKQVFIDKQGILKVSDGVVKETQKNYLSMMKEKVHKGDVRYISPQLIELVEDNNFYYYDKEKSDVFILGLIIIEAGTLKEVDYYNSQSKKADFFTAAAALERFQQIYPQKMSSVVEQMLNLQPKSRPKFEQLINKIEQKTSRQNTFEDSSSYINNESGSMSRQEIQHIITSPQNKPIEYESKPIEKHEIKMDNFMPVPNPQPLKIQNSFPYQKPTISLGPNSNSFNNSIPKAFNFQNNNPQPLQSGILQSHVPLQQKPSESLTYQNFSKPNHFAPLKFDSYQLTKPLHNQPIFDSKNFNNKVNYEQIPKNELNNVPKGNPDAEKIQKKLESSYTPYEKLQYLSNYQPVPSNSYKPFTEVTTAPLSQKEFILPTVTKQNSFLQKKVNQYEQKTEMTQGERQSLHNKFKHISLPNTDNIVDLPKQFPQSKSQASNSKITNKVLKNDYSAKTLENKTNRNFTICQINGSKYQGFKNEFGRKSGVGRQYFSDGGYYEGEWKNDQMEGYGKLFYDNGSIAYQGNWLDSQFNGYGKIFNDQTQKYSKQFDFRDFSNLEQKWLSYDGQFKNDIKHGKGMIILSNGQKFSGQFKDDQVHGKGEFFKKSGETISGFWLNNCLQ